MARYRVGWASGGGWWEAGGRLNLPLGLFGLAMSPRSASHGPKINMLRWPKRRLPITGVNFRPYVVLSMGPIVSVVNLQSCQNSI